MAIAAITGERQSETARNELTSVNHRILAWIKRHRAVLLAVAFIAQILASPLADRDPHAGAVLALILVATLVVGTSYQVNRKVADLALTPFCLLWFVARMLEAFTGPGHIYSHLAPAAGINVTNQRTSRSNNRTQ